MEFPKNKNRIFVRISFLLGLFALSFLIGCENRFNTDSDKKRILHTTAGGRINTLDPALSADLASTYMVTSFYDTLLQYDYMERPYKLIPSMLESMPEISEDMLHYYCTLKKNLYFQEDPCFAETEGKEARKVKSHDVIFSFLRIADARLHSPGFWLWRNKVAGIEEFYQKTSESKPDDMAPYDKGCKGFELIDDYNFIIHLERPDPRLLYALAMPYLAIVSRKAVEYYGKDLSEHPVGSGPFKLVKWQKNYEIILDRNPEFRAETFPYAENPKDQNRPLPYLDRIVCYLVEQSLSSWLLFLQGELDMTPLDKDNYDVVVNEFKLVPALMQRKIKMLQIPEFQINYVGFCFTDPVISGNIELRKAISLAYNLDTRIKHSNYTLIPANGPIPPGVPGYDKDFVNPYNKFSLEKAKEHLKKAGFTGGIDPKTGKALELTFDLGRTSPAYMQLAELMVNDMKKLGIKIRPVLNNWPRFLQKSREGQMQLFRVGWVGDYPDAENFLQLFYSPNAGSCNRAFYRDKNFDKLFEEILAMPDCPERTKKYREMAEYITEQCPWIFESFPVSYLLIHSWLENYIPHDFAYARWKYLSVNTDHREQVKNSFHPMKMRDLRINKSVSTCPSKFGKGIAE